MSSSNVGIPKLKGKLDPRKTWRFMLLATVYIFVLLINGLDEFLRSGFAVDFMFSPEWWYRVFRVLTSNIFIFVGTLLYLLDLALRTREDIIAKKNEVKIAVDKYIDPVTFDPFYLGFERERKINYYKRAMEAKLEKLESRAKMEDLALWNKQEKNVDEHGKIIDKEIDTQFNENKFCKKKKVLLTQLTDEFIQQHINYMKVPYRPNSKSFVTNGYNKPHAMYDEYAVEPRRSKLFWDLMPKFLVMAGFLIAGESVVVEFMMADSLLASFFNMLMKITPLMLQVYFAFAYCDAYIDEKVMVDFRKRLDIITLYLASLKKGAEAK